MRKVTTMTIFTMHAFINFTRFRQRMTSALSTVLSIPFDGFTGASFYEYAFEVFTIVEFTTLVCIVSAGVPILSLPTAEIYTKKFVKSVGRYYVI